MLKSFKLLAAALASLLLLSSLSGCAGGESADIREMREGLTAQDVASEMGLGINLGNTFEAYYSDDSNMCGFSQVVGEGEATDYETCWGAIETTREIIDGMRDAGFKTVRIPVYWGNGMENDSSYAVSKKLLKRIEQVVKWVLQDGMYCVINMHHYDERLIIKLDREDAVNAAKTVWKQVAERAAEIQAEISGEHDIFILFSHKNIDLKEWKFIAENDF